MELRKYVFLSVILLLSIGHRTLVTEVNAAVGDTTVCKWKDNKRCAFSMSFDDSMPTHASYVIPNLISRGFAGSFCIVPYSYGYAFRPLIWESLCSRTGMDFINHTWTHMATTDLTEFGNLVEKLSGLIWSLRPPGASKFQLFVQPGGGTWPPPADMDSVLVNYYCIRGRGVGLNEPGDPLSVWKAAVDNAIANGDWRGGHLHGVGPQAEYLYTDRGWATNDFITLLDYLVAYSSQVWVGANTNVHMYKAEHSSASVNVIEGTQNIVRLNLTSTADPLFNYDYPLTLITEVPGGWQCARITQGGNIITVKPVSSGKVMYDVVPNRGEIKLESSAMDTTAPVTSNMSDLVRDGTDSDVDTTSDLDKISANWSNGFADPESGIAKYFYRVGTTSGGSEVFDWVDNGTFTYVTTSRTHIALSRGVKYYVTVKAVNGVGLESSGSSDGQTAQTTPGYVKFSEDFETGNSDKWDSLTRTGNNTIQIVPEAAYQGNYGLKCHIVDNSTATIMKSTISAITNNFLKFYFKLSSNFSMPEILDSHENKLIRLAALYDSNMELAGGIYIAYMRNSYVGSQYIKALNIYVHYKGEVWWIPEGWLPLAPGSDFTTDKYSGFIPITAGEWHCIDLHTKADNGNGGVELWVDGEKILSYLVRDTSGNAVRYLSIGVDSTGDNVSGDVYFDNITLSDCLYTSVDTTPPAVINQVRDGTGADIDIFGFGDAIPPISANWDPSTDAESGIAKYWYAIGTTPGGTDAAGWTDNGTATCVSRNISFLDGTAYYFSVKAENGAGSQSAVTTSDGQVAISGGLNLPDLKPYPNPCDFSNGEVIKFKVGAAGSETGEIKIYTMSGKLVRKLSGSASGGTIEWDGTNEDGEKVSRGVYIYKIINAAGDNVTGKLAIVR